MDKRLSWSIVCFFLAVLSSQVGWTEGEPATRNGASSVPSGLGEGVARAKGGYLRGVSAYRVPDVELVDQDGVKLPLRKILDSGRPVLLNFIFTSCPSYCPLLSGIFAGLQKKAASQPVAPKLVSISIDPEHDTPARLRRYAKKFNAGPDWTFLTGTVEDVLAVQQAFDAYRGDKMSHSPLIFLRAPGSQTWVRLNGFMSAGALLKELLAVAGP